MSSGPLSPSREAKQWENKIATFDLAKEFSRQNENLTKNFGRDRFSYTAELHGLNAEYWAYNEARIAHGYPCTAWLQLGLLYAVGLHTAKEQGIVKMGTPFARFWRAHYFDWITFARRGAIYAWAGGLLAGTIMFGSPDLAFKRAVSKYHFWMSKEDLDLGANEMLLFTK